jgi:hypothetical protein
MQTAMLTGFLTSIRGELVTAAGRNQRENVMIEPAIDLSYRAVGGVQCSMLAGINGLTAIRRAFSYQTEHRLATVGRPLQRPEAVQ